MKRKGLIAKTCFRLILVVLLTITLATTIITNADARTYMCNSNPDYFTKRCTVHPYAYTKMVDGQAHKGHIVGCQFKSYICMDGVCKDNFGSAELPFDFSMDDFTSFCNLLCNNPACDDGWQ